MKRLVFLLAALTFGIGITTADTGNALSGKFTINEWGDLATFSSGNLQYDPQSKKFHFASTQYEMLGTKNSEVLEAIDANNEISGRIDLFGWGTGTAPTFHGTSGTSYPNFFDWGDNIPRNEGNKWRTLSMKEWGYLLSERDRAEQLFGLGSVNGVNGLILLPDEWQTPANLDFKPSTTRGLEWSDEGWCYINTYENNFDHNTYSSEDWAKMEAAGAVFLPAAGKRTGTSISFGGQQGNYWSSTPHYSDESSSYFLSFDKTTLSSSTFLEDDRGVGMAVRLIHEVPKLEAEVYTEFVESTGTLTYYYDKKRTERNGVTEHYDPVNNLNAGHFMDYTEKVKKIVIDPSMKDAPLTRVDAMFCGFSNYESYPLSAMTTIEGLENLNTSKVTDMSNMFLTCSLTSLDLSSLNSTNVTNMSSMFRNCTALTSLDLSSFNTDNVTDMSEMFSNCTALTSLDLSSFNTANVTNMAYMFGKCTALTSLDLSSFNTANVTGMSGIFDNCTALTSLDLSSFNTANLKYTRKMFNNCSSLTSLDFSSFNTDNVTDMSEMFSNCTALTSLDLSSFNTANLKYTRKMFHNCSSLTSLDLNSFNIANVTDMGEMFKDCSSLETIYCDNDWSTTTATSKDMFKSCTSLVGGKGTTYNSSFTDRTYARPDGGTSQPGYFMKKQKEVYTVFTEATGTLTYYYDMQRSEREGVTELYDPVDNPNAARFTGYYNKVTKAVIDKSMKDAPLASMYSMFFGGINEEPFAILTLPNMTEIQGLENLHTGNVTRMDYMFEGCNALQTVDVSSFDVSKVTNMDFMFGDCYKLTTIYCNKDWSTGTTISNNMFANCKELVGGEGTPWSSSAIDKTYARPDGGESKPGYFTLVPRKRGDVNGDGSVNTADVVATYSFIEKGEASGFSRDAADVNGDGSVNTADVVAIYSIIIKGE